MISCQSKKSRPSQRLAGLRVTNPHAAGIDVHAKEHWVAVPPEDAPPGPADQPAHVPAHVRRFGACTADLEMLADWLQACGVTSVAMESTGVYWIALFELLERRGFEVYLVDPRQTRHADQVVVLRSYLRQRQMLIGYGAQHIQHMQKALEQMNVKLTEVVRDIMGVTGLAIIKAILRGERRPRELAKLRDERCHHTEAEIARALYGNWRDEHLFALKQALVSYEFYQRQVEECDARLAAHLQTFADRSGGRRLPAKPTPGLRRSGNRPAFDVRQALYRASGVDLTILEGIDDSTALVLLSELGMDMSPWPTVKRFVSWLGLCPQHRGSAGKIRSRHVRRGCNRAARALRLAAQGCHHAKNALGAFYRRLQARAGGAKAVVATARKIAERVYRLLKYGADYVRQGIEEYEAKFRERVLKNLARKANELGYELVPVAAATP